MLKRVLGVWRHVRNRIDAMLMLSLLLVGLIGTGMLYGAADAHVMPWALPHGVRLIAGMGALCIAAALPARFWYTMAYWGYSAGVAMLLAVDLFGHVRKGAERWLIIGGVQIQPSEPMKLVLILCLARFFYDMQRLKSAKIISVVGGLVLTAVPAALVLVQPDLGTAMLLVMGGVVLFMAWGVRFKIWAGLAALGAAAVPFLYWRLHDYQRHRVDVFLNPDLDRLGKGYHILQSKIAIGAGGWFGRGFMKGTQSQLDFLPEKHTDFAFTAFAEQFGFVGAAVLLLLFMIVLLRLSLLAQHSKLLFGKLFGAGICTLFFIHTFINTCMVMGLVPVVGVPLPLFSYGGTSMLTLLTACGIAMSLHADDSVTAPRGKL